MLQHSNYLGPSIYYVNENRAQYSPPCHQSSTYSETTSVQSQLSKLQTLALINITVASHIHIVSVARQPDIHSLDIRSTR